MSGAGQYFTPRALIRAMVECVRPLPMKTIADPACGTGLRVDYVLANPPFGKKSSMTFTNEEDEQDSEDLTYNRQDFWVTTSNKQLNFKQGVKATVLFFDNHPAAKTPWTKDLWIYDFRTNIHFTLKKNPLKVEDLKDFIECYKPENVNKRQETYHPETNPEGRWRRFSYGDILARDKTSLDITWLKDKSLTDLDKLPDPDALANDIIENLEAGIESFKEIYEAVK